MGLGKTVQAISFMNYLKMNNMSSGPFLVLCPLSITDGWFSEFSKFCQNLKVLQYVGDKEHRRALRRVMFEHLQEQSASCNEQLLNFDVLLTTYEIALIDQDFLSQIPWQYAVIDEAQRLKNPASVLYRVLDKEYIIPRRLLMTGTPVQNNLSELWALMHFCMPYVFGTLEQFVSTFKDAGDLLKGQKSSDSAKEQFKILKHVLKAVMLRRTKALLIQRGTLTLPPLTEITMMVPFVALQRKVYMSILRRQLPALVSLSSGAHSHQSLQNTVMQLRKVCSHPYLFNGIEPEPYEEGEHLVQASGKLIVLDLLLQKLHACGHRVLLFAQMTHTLDILQDFLELRRYTYERLDGSVRAEERFAAIRNFGLVEKNNNAFVFMISTRAGGVGLNLVAADTVIFYEQDWNPQVDKQALQRAHRIGQINHVLSVNLVTQNTIEEVILRRAERKLQLSNNVMGSEVDCDNTGKDVWIDAGDMRFLILGLQIFDPTDNIADNLSVETMVGLGGMAEKVVQMRNSTLLKDNHVFEINPTVVLDGSGTTGKKGTSFSFDLGLDEASYLSWIEKFKEAAQSTVNIAKEVGRRGCLSEERHLKQEADRMKTEEKKLAKWEAHGYHSLAVKEFDVVTENDLISDSGSVQFVYGDCTKPSRVCPSEPAIIFSCVDNSGNWGHGGMFSALSNLSTNIPDAYHRASEFGDLHMGDLHLMKLNDGDEGNIADTPLWVALAVVQSYNSRRKVPRSDISIEDLEKALSKASLFASQNSASIHMPRIGYQGGSQRSEWYAIERLLRKYASRHRINIFVYYYRRDQQ
ncbi:putative chromatin-remodeling complex ATPase chain [Platanthera zijinensis]|uniref:Chromatin-remodeling complex ATPase chain n=1 Tax=Platanthera zijinensis TaxID=2320716 RepID=A0AAP0GF11_9ASPA